MNSLKIIKTICLVIALSVLCVPCYALTSEKNCGKYIITPEEIDNWQGMIEWCKEQIIVNSQNPDAWFNLGIAYYKSKRYDDAIEAYRKALAIDPKHVSAWYNLGTSYYRLKRYDDAIEAYRKALAIDPKSIDALNNLGTTYALSGNRTAAIGIVQDLRNLDPNMADKLLKWIESLPRLDK